MLNQCLSCGIVMVDNCIQKHQELGLCSGMGWKETKEDAMCECQTGIPFLGEFEVSCVIVKPNATRRMITGKILDAFETKGLRLHPASKFFPKVSDAILKGGFLKEHTSKPKKYNFVKNYLQSGPIFVALFQGPQAINNCRIVIDGKGKSNKFAGIHPLPGSLRGTYDLRGQHDNVVHGSSSLLRALEELSGFFPDYENLFKRGICLEKGKGDAEN